MTAVCQLVASIRFTWTWLTLQGGRAWTWLRGRGSLNVLRSFRAWCNVLVPAEPYANAEFVFGGRLTCCSLLPTLFPWNTVHASMIHPVPRYCFWAWQTSQNLTVEASHSPTTQSIFVIAASMYRWSDCHNCLSHRILISCLNDQYVCLLLWSSFLRPVPYIKMIIHTDGAVANHLKKNNNKRVAVYGCSWVIN